MNDIQIKKLRTESTANMIIDIVKHLDLTDLLSAIFVETKDEFCKELVKRYEFKLIEAHDNPSLFEKSLHSFYQEMANYIKKNNLYKEFYSFCYFIFTTLDSKRLEKSFDKKLDGALNSYFNILFQQANYFVTHPKMVYGLDSKGKLLIKDEHFAYLDVVLMEAYTSGKSNLTKESLYQKYRKIGLDIHTDYDFERYQANDHLISNMTLMMACLINEKTINIHPKKYYMIAEGIDLPNICTDTSLLKSILKEKSYFLPINGVTAKLKNMNEIQEIFVQEVYSDNRIILLYKCTTLNGGEFNGFYDNKLELFYSPWDSTDFGMPFHLRIENLILEIYALLTTDIDKMDSNKIKKRIHSVDNVLALLSKNVPTVEFSYKEKLKSSSKSKKENYEIKTFDKRNYKPTKVTINPFVRKLPTGANASDSAISLAKEFHYTLRDGETFVRPFEKTSYRKDTE